MSNRDVQPFQFACPACEESISFVYGTQNFELRGSKDIADFEGPFTGENPFVDLHLDFPASFRKYEMGRTTFFRVLDEIGRESFSHLSHRLSLLNLLYPKQRDLYRLIAQYQRGDIKAFEKIYNALGLSGSALKSHQKEDVLAALYSATSTMSSPFTIHENNAELSEEMPIILQELHALHEENLENFVENILANSFLKNLHHDCLSLYPKIVALDLPLRPAFYYDYADAVSLQKTPARVSASDFGSCSDFYKDLAEVFSRQLVLVAGINNLINRGDFDLFDNSVRLNKQGAVVKDFPDYHLP